jgi:transcriptional regulator
MLGGIVGFRIEITRLEGKWKLSQNQHEGRRQRVIEALETGDDPGSREVAGLMREALEEDRR